MSTHHQSQLHDSMGESSDMSVLFWLGVWPETLVEVISCALTVYSRCLFTHLWCIHVLIYVYQCFMTNELEFFRVSVCVLFRKHPKTLSSWVNIQTMFGWKLGTSWLTFLVTYCDHHQTNLASKKHLITCELVHVQLINHQLVDQIAWSKNMWSSEATTIPSHPVPPVSKKHPVEYT